MPLWVSRSDSSVSILAMSEPYFSVMSSSRDTMEAWASGIRAAKESSSSSLRMPCMPMRPDSGA